MGLRGFAAAAVDAYLSGVPAVELTGAVLPAEFDVEGSRRGMFGSSADATKFFALFVTTAYVTAEEEGLLPDFTRGRSAAAATETATATAEMDVDVEAASDPDMFAWAPAPGETTADEATDDEARRRRSVAGMRESVRAWMDMDRAALEARVSKQLSEDEDDEVSASMDEMDEVMDDALTLQQRQEQEQLQLQQQRRAAEPSAEGRRSEHGRRRRHAFLRDDFLASTSITIAALTIQRAIVSLVLQELKERGVGGGDDGGNVE